MNKVKDEVLKMDTLELQRILDEDIKDRSERKHILVHGLLILLLLFSLGYFTYSVLNPNRSSIMIIKDLILTLFIIFYVVTSITYRRYHKTLIFFSGLLLCSLLVLNVLFDTNIVINSSIPNFSNKKVQDVMKWAKKNNIDVIQVYEYSDMIDEYKVISQKYEEKDKEITISISEGMNPYKEIMIPSMITWNSDQVLDFVKKNSLSNVSVDYISSDQAVDTVIEQSVTGSLRRNEELKLVFSYGEELGFQEVSLIDFSNMSQFEVELYMKKNHLRYEFLEDFSNDIKKGYVLRQSISKGEIVQVDDTRIQVTFSKGKAVKIIDFKDYDMVKITDWAIKNKMKIHFLEEYDDSVSKGKILSVNPKTGEEVSEGSSLEVTISKGTLKMPKFKSLNDFYEWAKKNHISYLEEHEFSDKVKAGEVISYSYKEGEVIKNHDAITVKISDGSKKTVPNLKGLSKEEAVKKLDDLGLKYNFIYEDSDSKKDTVLKQSISPNSEISTGLTITLTLAN